MKRLFFLLLLLLGGATAATAQEIKAAVRINTPQLQNTDRKVFDALEAAIKDWLNNTKWTADNFEQEERINVSITITVSQELSENTFDGDLLIQSTRPVYGSGYETALLSHLDKDFNFTYDMGQPLNFSKEAIDNPLTATLAFYVYYILGLDYDSFSLYGGDPHYAIAQDIMTAIPPGIAQAYPGWRPTDNTKNRNRYWMMENTLNPRVKPFRKAYYTYHFNGLDRFATDPEKGRKAVMEALEDVDKVNSAYINSMILQMFSNAKKDEITEMWKQGTPPQKQRVVEIMSKVDPANVVRYREIGI